MKPRPQLSHEARHRTDGKINNFTGGDKNPETTHQELPIKQTMGI